MTARWQPVGPYAHGPLFSNLVWERGGAALVIRGLKWTVAEKGGEAGETLDWNTWASKLE